MGHKAVCAGNLEGASTAQVKAAATLPVRTLSSESGSWIICSGTRRPLSRGLLGSTTRSRFRSVMARNCAWTPSVQANPRRQGVPARAISRPLGHDAIEKESKNSRDFDAARKQCRCVSQNARSVESTRRPQRAMEFMSEDVDYWDVTTPGFVKGRAEVVKTFQSFFDAFPDLRFEIKNIFGCGDNVACEWRCAARNRRNCRVLMELVYPSTSWKLASVYLNKGKSAANRFLGRRHVVEATRYFRLPPACWFFVR